MPSKQYNGNSPLGGKRIDSRKGVDSAIGQLSQDIGKRTPKQSMTAGSMQVHNGVFHIPKRQRKAKIPAHPFKATANGDNTVAIGQGYAMNWGTSGDISLGFTTDWAEFIGADVTVTDDGTIWAVINATDAGAGYSWFTANSITVELDPTIVADNIYIPICEVFLTGGVATVTKQFLRQDISMPM